MITVQPSSLAGPLGIVTPDRIPTLGAVMPTFQGFGASDTQIKAMAKEFIARVRSAANYDTRLNHLVDALWRLSSDEERAAFSQELITLGVSATLVADAQNKLRRIKRAKKIRTVWAVLGTLSMAASTYHGYKRNNSVGWAIGWGILGAMFPVITPAVAVAEGFGKRK